MAPMIFLAISNGDLDRLKVCLFFCFCSLQREITPIKHEMRLLLYFLSNDMLPFSV